MERDWTKMTAEELIAAGYKPVQIQHTQEEGWHEVKPETGREEQDGTR